MTTIDPTVVAEPNELGTTALTPSVVPVLIPTSRYRTESFAEQERTGLWPKVWQIACTTSHVPEPGDFFEFRCGEISVIVVRGEDWVLRGFQNACRHRGNAICQGGGSGLTELRCPYHRWAWGLDGRLREVPSRRAFGPGLKNDDYGLIPVQVDSWGPLVFVNLDLEAMPLAEYLEAIPDDASWSQPDEYRCDVAVTVSVNSNWKVVAEGFSETYHVQGIHPELHLTMDDIHAPQIIWGLHGASYQPYGVPNPRQGRDSSDQAVWDGFVKTQGARMGVPEPCPVPEIPEGQTVNDVIADLIRKLELERGVDLSDYSAAQITSLSQYNFFPNASVLISADMFHALVARPGPSVDEATLTIITCRRRVGDAVGERIDEFVVPESTPMGVVMGQDLALLRTAQVGLKQPGLTHLAVGAEEPRIINLHRNLEAWLGISPSELLPIDGAERT